jgi:hypothetical protein
MYSKNVYFVYVHREEKIRVGALPEWCRLQKLEDQLFVRFFFFKSHLGGLEYSNLCFMV